MLAVKTKGNLDKREEQLLQQNLTALRMAFVETLRDQGAAATEPAKGAAGPSAMATGTSAHPNIASPAPDSEEESRKKFTKKY